MAGGGKILLIGNTCLDIVVYTEGFPVEDRDYRDAEQTMTLGGNVTNSAKVLKQLGANIQLFTSVPSNHTLYEELRQRFDLDVSRCVRRPPGAAFPLTVCLVNTANGSRTLFNPRKGITWPSAQQFITEFPMAEGGGQKGREQFSWTHFEINADFVYEQLYLMCRHVVTQRNAARKGIVSTACGAIALPVVSLELEHPVPVEWLRQLVPLVDVVFLSKDVARHHGWTSMEQAAQAFPTGLDGVSFSGVLICPWGEKGVSGRAPTGEVVSVAAHHPSSGVVVDTLAAGDCFIAAAIHFLNELIYTDNDGGEGGCGGGDISRRCGMNVTAGQLRASLEKAAYVAGESVGQRGLEGLNLAGLLPDLPRKS